MESLAEKLMAQLGFKVHINSVRFKSEKMGAHQGRGGGRDGGRDGGRVGLVQRAHLQLRRSEFESR